MFAYCNNNPGNHEDSDGREPKMQFGKRELSVMMLFGAAASIVILTNPEAVKTISKEADRVLNAAKQEIYEYAQIVKQEISAIKKKMPHVHHIVPAGDFSSRNEATHLQIIEMHTILYSARINRFIDPMNLMIVSAGTHSTLHTNQYIDHVHSYLKATDGSKLQIYYALFALRIEIAALDMFASGY